MKKNVVQKQKPTQDHLCPKCSNAIQNKTAQRRQDTLKDRDEAMMQFKKEPVRPRSPIPNTLQMRLEETFNFDENHEEPVQRKGMDDYEDQPVQRKGADGYDEEPMQYKPDPSPNKTGLPDQLKNGIESMSGMSMDDVKVHFNSQKPAQLQALAYTQGSDIHVGPGQEKHLPHEAWHVVQQKQGRVSPTINVAGLPVNDQAGLEREADVMGSRAIQLKKASKSDESMESAKVPSSMIPANTIQLNKSKKQVVFEIMWNYYRETSTRVKELMERGDTVPDYLVRQIQDVIQWAREDEFPKVEEEMQKLLLELNIQESDLESHDLIGDEEGVVEKSEEHMDNLIFPDLDLSNLVEIEPWHEDAMTNMRQGMTKKESERRLKKSEDLTMREDMDDFLLGNESLGDHLKSIRNEIIDGEYLIRRISKKETLSYDKYDESGDLNDIFPKGFEKMKAFVVDKEYSFKDKKKDSDKESYAAILRIKLTPELKTFLLNFLTANTKEILETRFSFNPQFKFEQGGVTILIPKAGWAQFWAFVDNDFTLN